MEVLMDEAQKVELEKVVKDLLNAENKPNKFLELLFCRRFLSVLAIVGAVVAKHYGLQINDTELLSLAAAVGSLVLGHSLRKPNA